MVLPAVGAEKVDLALQPELGCIVAAEVVGQEEREHRFVADDAEGPVWERTMRGAAVA